VAQLATQIAFRKAGRVSVGRDRLLSLIEIALEPLLLPLSLWTIVLYFQGQVEPQDVILGVVVFAMTFPGPARLSQSPLRAVRNILAGWIALAGLLAVFGYASGYLDYFDLHALVTWWWVAPVSQLAGHFLLRASAPVIRALQGGTKRAVVAGMNEQGVELAMRLADDVYSDARVVGFFDDRTHDRLAQANGYPMLGKIADLARYVQRNHVDLVYLSLPMASQDRILALLQDLRDTTASIYFVPDIFVTDLIQGRMDSISGMPIVGVCESPFSGMDGMIKRASDILLSLAILVLISPLLLILALAVKLSSPGPIVFRQRRYGLDGEEIVVYKFRTMLVTEDGSVIRQATRTDPRITRLGAVMRRTSLDELPQFINVLQGRMSIVGPRPHAVAHNEMYRKLIKGYMQRHKVKPGITGWAQVSGLRGETDTIEKMKARIEYDLDYLRNWSLRLDLFIVAKTVWVVLRGQNAH
jgi:putative colanic acid biosynthesis UDP-glucose lipid carrier transferase